MWKSHIKDQWQVPSSICWAVFSPHARMLEPKSYGSYTENVPLSKYHSSTVVCLHHLFAPLSVLGNEQDSQGGSSAHCSVNTPATPAMCSSRAAASASNGMCEIAAYYGKRN